MTNKFTLRTFLPIAVGLSLSVLTGCGVTEPNNVGNKVARKEDKRPNIVWLITEDNSKHYLDLYQTGGAKMPTIESFAKQGLVFENAFANSPVCSTARTTLATGMYGTTIGTMNHRRYQKAALPNGLLPFSQILKDAGYYTSNNVKTDYNFTESNGIWSDSSKKANWRDREEGQPFFHVQTFAITHEGKLHFKAGAISKQKTKHDPAKVPLAPIYPDTETFRYTHARTLDNHKKADNMMANLVKQLEQDGELENTFIFYFGDHGGVLPGSKGYLFETGLSVPLVVRIPENFKHLVGNGLEQEGTRVNGFVSFIDFAPTVLELAGVKAPDVYPGQSFLSEHLGLSELNQRDVIFGQADRFDEKSDLLRSVRKGNFKYIRNYQPYYPDGLENFYRYKQLAFKEWRDLYHKGALNKIQSAFFQPKAPEALYDLVNDPHETINLAESKNHQAKLKEMRNTLRQHQLQHSDLGFLAESALVQLPLDSSYYEYGVKHRDYLNQLIDIADLQLQPLEKAKPALIKALQSDDANQVYRALIVATSFNDKNLTPYVFKAQKAHSDVRVKARALEYNALINGEDVTDAFLTLYHLSTHEVEKVELLNIAALLKEQTDFRIAPDKRIYPPQGTEKMVRVWLDNRWKYITE